MLSNLFRNIPPVTLNLLILNVLIYLGIQVMPQFYHLLALHHPQSVLFYPHQFLTHIFMHGSSAHIFGNMFGLVIFGSQLEKVWGAKKFLIVYFASAAGAFALQLGLNYGEYSEVMSQYTSFEISQIKEIALNFDPYGKYYSHLHAGIGTEIYSMVGASGAIFGLLAAYAYLFPNTELMLIFLPIPIKAKYFIPFYMAVELYLGVNDFAWDNVAHWAHIGGGIVGFLLVYFWNKDRKNFY